MAFLIGTICVIVGAGCEAVACLMLIGAWQTGHEPGVAKMSAGIGLGLIVVGLAGLALG